MKLRQSAGLGCMGQKVESDKKIQEHSEAKSLYCKKNAKVTTNQPHSRHRHQAYSKRSQISKRHVSGMTFE